MSLSLDAAPFMATLIRTYYPRPALLAHRGSRDRRTGRELYTYRQMSLARM